MYAERWSPRLRQGDVFGQIYFPLSKKAGFQRVSAATSLAVDTRDVGTAQLMVGGSPRLAAVVSHDCEFNPGKRDHFLIARLQQIPKDILSSPEKLEELRSGNDYAARAKEGRAVAIDSFVFEPLPRQFEEHEVLDFASIVPLPIGLKNDMLKLKRAELKHEHRALLRAKLAAFFGRDTEDVPDVFKIQPVDDPSTLEWQEIPIPDEE